MITLENPNTYETYHIRSVPLDEAMKLKAAGTVMYDYTKITAINTCPTWGVMRYGLHKTDIPMTASGRNLAIEAGSACHDFFAAIRLWTLIQQPKEGVSVDALLNVAKYAEHGIKLFGRDRWRSACDVPQDSDSVNNAQRFALDILHSTGYYDDPSDRKRTMSNMEVSCMAYADRYFQSNMPVAVKGDFIGIEIPFVLEVTKIDSSLMAWEKDGRFVPEETIAYYCGRIDGIHHYGTGYAVAENKTAAQLSASWRTSFAISNQVTGYTIAGTCIFGEEINDAIVMGTQIPLPRDMFNGVVFEPQSRTLSDRIRWCEWFFEGIATYERFIESPTHAPRYPHSCNRFFSACQFIPFCASTREEQVEALEQMRIEEWSPLDHLIEEPSDA